MTEMVQLSRDYIAQSGKTYYTVDGNTRHIFLDHLIVGGEPVTFICRNHLTTKIVLHLPEEARWRDIDGTFQSEHAIWDVPSNQDRTSPRELGTLQKVTIFRRSKIIYNIVEKEEDFPVPSTELKPDFDGMFLVLGQSLAQPFSDGISAYGVLDQLNSNYRFVGAASGGSAVFYAGDSDNHWLNNDLTDGPLTTEAKTIAGTYNFDGIIWIQGHGDIVNLRDGVYSFETYMAGVEKILETFSNNYNIPVYIQIPAHTINFTSPEHFQNLREYYNVLGENYNIFSYENYDMTTTDGVHPDEKSEYKGGERLGRIINGEKEPELTHVLKISDTVAWISFDKPMKPVSFRGMYCSEDIVSMKWKSSYVLEVEHTPLSVLPHFAYPHETGYHIDVNDVPSYNDMLLSSFSL